MSVLLLSHAAGCSKTLVVPGCLRDSRVVDCPIPATDVPDMAPLPKPDIQVNPPQPDVIPFDFEADGKGSAEPSSEKCNGQDDDQDGTVDEEDAQGCQRYYVDSDKDGFGGNQSACLCEPYPPYMLPKGGDCYDLDDKRYPGAAESCFNLDDDDCDGFAAQKACDSKECGPDGCGGSCGSCPGGACNAYGYCVEASHTCYSSCHCPAGQLCGTDNLCHGPGDVASPWPHPACCTDSVLCAEGDICRAMDGSSKLCPGPVCFPASCQSLGYDCGTAPDGCGGVMHCGLCSEGQTCGAVAPHVCGSGTCQITSCEQQGKDCGLVSNGCDGLTFCGACQPGEPCGGKGVGNVCGGAPVCEDDKDATFLENGEGQFFPLDGNEMKLFFFVEKSDKNQGNTNPITINVIDQNMDSAGNVDLLVKYVGYLCEFARPTMADYEDVISGAISSQGDGGIFFSAGGGSLELVTVPDNPEGYYYVFVYNDDDQPEVKMKIVVTDPDSY